MESFSKSQCMNQMTATWKWTITREVVFTSTKATGSDLLFKDVTETLSRVEFRQTAVDELKWKRVKYVHFHLLHKIRFLLI